MIETLNTIAMILTIAFGAIGWYAPRYTMKKLDLKTDGSPLGLSEIRAANGALFIGIGAAALFLPQPLAYAMVGFAYAGAAFGRSTSIVVDHVRQPTAFIFVAAEIVLAAYLILANLNF